MIDKAASISAFVFYPAAAAIVAASAFASFGHSLFPLPAAPVEAAVESAAYRFDPADLARMKPGASQVLHAERAWDGAVRNVSLATLRTAGEPAPAQSGARLIIAPAIGQDLTGRRLHVSVAYRQLYQNSATHLALRAEGGAGKPWLAQPIVQDEGQLNFSLPPSEGPVTAIALWPIPQTGAYYTYYGIELTDLTIKPER